MKKSDRPYLQHILNAIEQIEVYAQEVTYNDYIQSPLLQDGYIRQLAIIGEASNQLSNELKETSLDIPWTDIVAMRNKLVHEYFGVDLSTVWATVQNDLPNLKTFVLKKLH